MEHQIHELEISIRPKKDALKLAQTRLENRKDHPNVEKAIDDIDYGEKIFFLADSFGG